MSKQTHAPRFSRRRVLISAAVVAVIVAVGGVGLGTHLAQTAAAQTKHIAKPKPGFAGKLQNPVADAPVAASTAGVIATRVQIPSIGVDTKLIGLDLKPHTNQLKAPLDFNVAGWYVNGTIPGNIGPAVIDGHVDSPTAPGVFLHLSKLKIGAQIAVTLSNKEVKTFVVTKTMPFPKTKFPTDEVYGPTPTPQLRVITCDGIFNKATGHYLDNLVVFASLVS
jgi:sortase (surface protein transpeptidase)